MTLIKSISGIRGTIGGQTGDTLNPLDIVKFTTAYAQFIGGKKIVVGRDGRISGLMVRNVVVGTLMGMGYDVLDIGYATTPTTELAVRMSGADGGIIITASHNPRQWNALKLLNREGEFLTAADGAEVLRMAEAEVVDLLLGDRVLDDDDGVVHVAALHQPLLGKEFDLVEEHEGPAWRDFGPVIGVGVPVRVLDAKHPRSEIDGNADGRFVRRSDPDPRTALFIVYLHLTLEGEVASRRVLRDDACGREGLRIRAGAAVEDGDFGVVETDEGIVHSHAGEGGKDVLDRHGRDSVA